MYAVTSLFITIRLINSIRKLSTPSPLKVCTMSFGIKLLNAPSLSRKAKAVVAERHFDKHD